MSFVSQNLILVTMNSSHWRWWTKRLQIFWSVAELLNLSNALEVLHPRFQKNNFDLLLSKQNFHHLFCYCLGFDWCQDKFLAKVLSTADESWCWTAMSAYSLKPLVKYFPRKKRSQVESSRAFSFCELAVGTWGIFEGFLLFGIFSRDRRISSWLLLQKSIFFLSIARRELNYLNGNSLTKKKIHQELEDCILFKVIFLSVV